VLKPTASSNTDKALDQADAEFIRLFGPTAGPAVQAIMIRVGTLSGDEVGALAARWQPSMAFLTAQAAAWKAARKAKMTKDADFAYNATYSSMPHNHPGWAAAGNVAAHAALGAALGSRLRPDQAALLVAPWDETITPLPEPTEAPKARIRKRAPSGG
jgi:hypothetical protein